MNTRSPIRTITLTRAEGPAWQCGQPKVVHNWLDANVQLKLWSDAAPDSFGYDKIDFKIQWANGFEYTGRYDLVRWRCGEPEPDLAAHVRSNAYFHTGRWTPSHMTAEEHRQFLAPRLSAAEAYERLLYWQDLNAESHPDPRFDIGVDMQAVRDWKPDGRKGSW